MSESFYPRRFRARTTRLVSLLGVVALALAGCGSTAATKPPSHPSATTQEPLASTPAHHSIPRGKTGKRHASAAGAPGTTTPVASPPCPAGEKRTATGLCYSPAAQRKLVARLGPCLVGQVVADNGACQPLTNHPSLPARCRRANRAGCVPRGSRQGGGLRVAPGPGFDTVFH